MTVKLPFPVPDAIYDDLVLRVDGQPVPTTTADGAVAATIKRPPGSLIRVEAGYRSQGMSKWSYSFGEGVTQVRDFALEMRTTFDEIDFAQGTLSPVEKKRAGTGWLLGWKYTNVVTGYGIGMVMPEKLQPGPLAGRISYFAPVSLLFFFFLMVVITSLRKIELHPMHYFFLATSFFAFHLLLAYLVDHISIHAAFIICSAVSIFLVVSYLRIVVNARFAWREAAISQFVYLVLFSYAFFLQRLHRPGHHHRCDRQPLRGHAGDGTRGLARRGSGVMTVGGRTRSRVPGCREILPAPGTLVPGTPLPPTADR